ncbi:MAG TPA: UbiA family prenyltransferase [Anaeromyxobacteraceae bacterium]|nr:UbiA family prenyltransferase [Anaeromyxobacteraceae bacterium]
MRGRARLLADLATLAKLRISALSTLTAATGFLAASRALRPPLAATIAGTFLLAAAAAALNEILDRERDARMLRTAARPIPAGRIGVPAALGLALVAGGCGLGLLGGTAGALPALLGLGALAWYDAVYTPLKRVTAFAVLPGAVVGALPPAIGWTAAGGALGDARLHAICAFLFLWQVPHFWLLAHRHAEDYRRAGLPTPASRFSPDQLGRIALTWTLATAATAPLLSLFGVTRSAGAAFGLLAAAAMLGPPALALPRSAARPEALARGFWAVNLFAVAVMLLVAADALR